MKWDLTYHFKNQEEFEKALEEVNQMVAKFGEYEGKLNNEESFVEYCLLSKNLKKMLLEYTNMHL